MRLLKFILFLPFIFSCEKEIDRAKIVYNGGSHQASSRSDNEFRRLLNSKKKTDDYFVRFSHNSRYLINNPNGKPYMGWNKIGGTFKPTVNPSNSFGVHDDSYRMVWRYSPLDTSYGIAYYQYQDGERRWHVIQDGIKEGEVAMIPNFKLKYAFVSEPYFGGVYEAPHDVIIEIW